VYFTDDIVLFKHKVSALRVIPKPCSVLDWSEFL